MTERESSPFIIWTFRRSGGTNLAQLLFDSSDYKAVQHEPFNKDRVFGHVVAAWDENKDIEEASSLIEDILCRKPLIKHCVEIIPDEINKILLDTSVKYGYKHLFLYRECPTDRLLSLNFSILTNIWGKKQRESRPLNQDVFKTPIDSESLIQHEISCRRKMRSVYASLIENGQVPMAVSFESLYQSGFDYSSKLVKDLFEELGIDKKTIRDSSLTKILKGNRQGTNSEYMRFPGAEDFVMASTNLGLFKLSRAVNEIHSKNNPQQDLLEFFEIWNLLPAAKESHFILSGVLLPRNYKKLDIWLETDLGEVVKLNTGLSSPRVAKIFSDNSTASHCRFMSEAFSAQSATLYLKESSCEPITLYGFNIL
jgi:hypothetical protein